MKKMNIRYNHAADKKLYLARRSMLLRTILVITSACALLLLFSALHPRFYLLQIILDGPDIAEVSKGRQFSYFQKDPISFEPQTSRRLSHGFHPTAQDTGKVCDIIDDAHKFDCHPEMFATKKGCESRGCCWQATEKQQESRYPKDPLQQQAEMGVPFCYYPRNYPGYTVTKKSPTTTGFVISMSKNTTAYYPDDVKELVMVVTLETSARLRMQILDPNRARWRVPLDTPSVVNKTNSSLYEFEVADVGMPFSMAVSRKTTSGKVTLLNTTGAFMYTNQFLQLSYYLPSPYIYGLGEHRSRFLLNVNWTRLTMWTKDHPPLEDTNLYGDHPFYLMMENDGSSHGVFLLNSNAMDVILQPAPAITWRTIGGVIDLYMFLGPTPGEVIEQYTEVIGRTFMPPYWSLGFHLSRWGYKTADGTLAVTNRVRAAGIPQDTQWNDLDYMEGRRDFTSDMKTFGDQAAMVEELHKRGMHYIMIVDPGISPTQPPGTYPPYDIGLEQQIFINDTEGKPLVGVVWPGRTVFPDFSNPKAHSYWTTMVTTFHKQVAFDGMWIDMNEISNFITGSVTGCPEHSNLDHPPYVPAVRGGSLRFSTICASAQQYLSTQYNLHNLYGLNETRASYKALVVARGKRPFVISRSTYAGQGHYGGHWTGDNEATFYDMGKSITAILNMNLFGVTMVGADICGFRKSTTEQLCQRWHQLGAFYTFSRNHNSLLEISQDPAAFGEALAASTRKVYLTRYSLLPFLYTLIHKSNAMGHTVTRPLFFEYPTDVNTYSIDTQFLWGSSLLISPVLHEGTVSVDAYFPKGTWYDFYDGLKITSTGQTFTMDAAMDKINLHVRAGSILPMQEPALTTTESRKNRFWLLVALNETAEAEGDLFWDDGDSIGTHDKGIFNMIRFSAAKNTVSSQTPHIGYTTEPMVLGNVTVMGMSSQPSQVVINEHNATFDYQASAQVLYVTNFTVNLMKPFLLQWIS